MPGSLRIGPGILTVIKDGRVALDRNRRLLNRVPSGTITLSDYDIEFPNLRMGVNYHQMRYTPGFGSDYFGCMSFAGLIDQEWGPAEASPFTLPDILLGTAPRSADFLDVRARLTNTVVPAGWFDQPMRSDLPSGEWINLEGGSCLVEFIPGMRRLFEIVLELDPEDDPETNPLPKQVLLRRYQSVTKDGPRARSGYNQSTANTSANYLGYVATTEAPNASGKFAIYGAIIQAKGLINPPTTAATFGPGGSNGCSLTPPSYASTWSGDLIITPGRRGT
jgi:hypothetical protein